MKDKRNRHGAVGKLRLEQQFHKSDAITFAVLNFWSHTPSATGSYCRLADEIQVIFEIFKIHYRRNNGRFSLFNKCTALLQLCQCLEVGFFG